jgi:hypothetical protein
MCSSKQREESPNQSTDPTPKARINSTLAMPMFSKAHAISAVTILSLAVFSGCHPNWDSTKAPSGFAIIREHIIEAPNNIPPIHSKLDFTIIEVDGAPVTRETAPALVDMQPGALVAAGSHHLRARVAPHLLPPNYQPHEVSFESKVESGKVYFIVDNEGAPVLVEARVAP